MTLPVDAVLPELIAALENGRSAVLVAPTGSGKTTGVAPVLMNREWARGGKLLLLSPRRLAARAAAERMAAVMGEPVGRTIGYRTRMDSKTSATVRVEVLTEGVFTRLVQDDPELAGIAAILFDEVHERNLEGDLGLALALEVQGALRPDLRIVAMSATVAGERYAALLGGAPVIEAEGRMYPVGFRYLGRDPNERIEDAMARAVSQALREEEGSVLAFLPGAAEIERVAERLRASEGVEVYPLYGALEGSVQRAAIEPAAAGSRKVVLATSIAETSLTIDGVRVVIDSGLARKARYDRASGMTRLVTERASQAAVAQRAGRAGRTQPGVAWRLWEQAQTAGLRPFDTPEILDSDLTGLVLDLAIWGAEPEALPWLDAPPEVAVAEARERLRMLGALDADGRPTAHGRAIARLPLPPRLAHMMVLSAERGLADVAARVAVLMSERGIGGRDADVEVRLRAWERARDRRSGAARGLAERWARLVRQRPSTSSGRTDSEDPTTSVRGEPVEPRGALGDPDAPGIVTALAYPDRVARRRAGGEGAYLMRSGRAVTVDPADGLAKCEWLAVAEASGAAGGARVLLAAPIGRETVEALFGDAIETRASVRFDARAGGVVAEEVRSLGAIALGRRPIERAEPALVTAALVEGVRTLRIAALPWSEATAAFRARVAFARGQGADLPDLSDAALSETLGDWLPDAVGARRRIEAIDPGALHHAVEAMLDWPGKQRVEALAPARLETPAGTSHAIDYAAEGGPAVEVRVQELFGLSAHPTVGRGVPLALVLLSPARRPIQVTRDLPGFWAGSWKAVKAEMKGRYPRHPWPDDPAAASATTRTKNADARARGQG